MTAAARSSSSPAATAPATAMRLRLACLTVSGCRVPLPLLEALSFGRDEIEAALADLRRRTRATQLCLVSTCERTEIYAIWDEEVDPGVLVEALAGNRGVPAGVVAGTASLLSGVPAVEHLLRVTAGLESFVLGDKDIVGQVRAAAAASRSASTCGLELERLMDASTKTSRRVHRTTRFGEGGRSVAAAAVQLAAGRNGGDLRGRRVLVVGAGQVATEVVQSAARLGAAVTVCNRTRRHADRFAAAGADVVGLDRMLDVLATADVAIFGTAAPHRLVEAAQLEAALAAAPSPSLLLLDLCVPRNVDPAVRSLAGVTLLDLADLRAAGSDESSTVARDVANAEQVVGQEVDRYLRWLAGRSAAVSVRRLRADVEAHARAQVELATRGVPRDLQPLVEHRVRRAVLRSAHGPTKRLLQAAEDGDDELVEALSGLFAPVLQDG